MICWWCYTAIFLYFHHFCSFLIIFKIAFLVYCCKSLYFLTILTISFFTVFSLIILKTLLIACVAKFITNFIILFVKFFVLVDVISLFFVNFPSFFPLRNCVVHKYSWFCYFFIILCNIIYCWLNFMWEGQEKW